MNQNNSIIELKLITFLDKQPGNILAFAWGFMEGTLFFIVPDVLFTLTALFNWKQAIRQVAFTLLGSIVAGVIMFNLSAAKPEFSQKLVLGVPFVKETMLTRVNMDYEKYGALGLMHGPLSAIPYKAYAIEAPKHILLTPFILASIPARLERFLGGLMIFIALGYGLRSRIQQFPKEAIYLHAIYWIITYTSYWLMI